MSASFYRRQADLVGNKSITRRLEVKQKAIQVRRGSARLANACRIHYRGGLIWDKSLTALFFLWRFGSLQLFLGTRNKGETKADARETQITIRLPFG